MRLFELLNFQHAVAYFFPGLLFMLVFGLGLAFAHLHGRESERRKNEIIGRFPEEIADRNAPFPLVMMLIIGGTVIWGFLYILMHGMLDVKV